MWVKLVEFHLLAGLVRLITHLEVAARRTAFLRPILVPVMTAVLIGVQLLACVALVGVMLWSTVARMPVRMASAPNGRVWDVFPSAIKHIHTQGLIAFDPRTPEDRRKQARDEVERTVAAFIEYTSEPEDGPEDER